MEKYIKQTLLSGLVLFSAPTFAQSTDWQSLNLSLADQQVIPGYQKFAASGEALSVAGQTFCAQSDPASLNALQENFHQAMDDWQSIQHIRFGPITYFNWQYRLHYWPDDKGSGGRQLSMILANQDPAIFEEDQFSRLSVGVQGFPALERLLFSEDSLNELQADAYRCQLMSAITKNIGEIAAGLSERWQSEFRASIALTDDSGYFEDAEDASIEFVKALVESLPLIREQKLLEPLDDDFESWRERKAESWRSRRSLRNIKLNIAALADFFHESDLVTVKDIFVEEDADVVKGLFEKTQALLSELPDSFSEQMIDEQGYKKVVELEQLVDALYESVEAAVKNTDLYLGFNSLDGD